MNQRQSLSSSQSSRRRNSTRSSSEATGQPCASQRSNSWSSSRMPRRQRQRTRRSSAAGSVSCGLTLAGSGSGPLLSPPTRALVERGRPAAPSALAGIHRRRLERRPSCAAPFPVQALARFGAAVRCPSAGTLRGRHSLSKRWHLAGPPFPGDMSHPSGRHPVFTKGRGTSMCHLGHIPRARRPSRTCRSWLRS